MKILQKYPITFNKYYILIKNKYIHMQNYYHILENIKCGLQANKIQDN